MRLAAKHVLATSFALLGACGALRTDSASPESVVVPSASSAHDEPSPAPESEPANTPLALATEPVAIEPEPDAAPPRPLLVLDTHCDTTQRLLDEHADLTSRLPDGHVDVPRMREGGLSGLFLSIWVDPRRYRGEAAWTRAIALLDAVDTLVAAHPDELALCRTASEVRAAHAAGRIAILMGVEGAHAFGQAEPDVLLERVDEAARRGVRYVTLTWTNDNVFGHASTGVHPRRGLTELGRTLVERLNDRGVMVDVSHVSDQTALDAIEHSRSPVIASHSSARALADHPRNLPDAILRRIGATHGAVCLNYYAHFLDPAYGEARRALEREHAAEFDALPDGRSWHTARARNALARQLAPALRPPPLRVLVAHAEHVAQIAGPASVCLGSDFDGITELPEGMDDVTDLPRLLALLGRAGLDVPAIAGENVLRVLAASEAGARPN